MVTRFTKRRSHRGTRRLPQRKQKGAAIPRWLLYLLSVSPTYSNITPNIKPNVIPADYDGVIKQIKQFESKPSREDDADDDEAAGNNKPLVKNNYPLFNASTTVHAKLDNMINHLPYSKRVNPLAPNEKWVPTLITGAFDLLSHHADLQTIYSVDTLYWNIYCTGDPLMPVNYFEGYTYEDIAELKKEIGYDFKDIKAIVPLCKTPLYLIALVHSLELPDYNGPDSWRLWACAGRKMGLNIPLEDPRSIRNIEERSGIFRNTPDRISKELVKSQILLHGINPDEVLANAWQGSTLAC